RESRRCSRPPASSIRECGLLFAGAVIGVALVRPPPLRAADLWHAAAAPAASQSNSRWLRIGDDRAAEGRFAAAAAAYVAAIAAGPTAPVVSVHLGDVLMAAGELAAAQASYRSAISAASVGTAPAPGSRELAHLDDAHSRGQDRALACFGLAAALDRTGQASAARQMVREGLAADPTAAVLEVATLPDTDIRIVPQGEVFFRLGVVRQASGRRGEAAAAFREYLERVPGGPWAETAQAHLVELESPAGRRPGRGAAGGPRLLAAATVLATGGAPAPLIDAAWRDQAGLLDDCLAEGAAVLGGGSSLRIAIELEIDGHGRVVSAVAKLPVPAADAQSLAQCLEEAVRRSLRLPAPPGGRGTRARTELLIGLGAL
ncbi:MAG TPA: tetratricopeptide repeat protein, partial [Polyangia bacterium]|nr:tetratricopeptide repeat protein [Polyangia bacterium]